MNQKQSSSESGQVLVILMLAIVGLLAFTALAIDGGMLLADRRGAQNAGDASVMAGGYRIAHSLDDYELGIQMDYETWDCSSTEMATATGLGEEDALEQAIKNGYPIDPISGTVNIEGDLFTTCADEDMVVYFDRYVDTEVVLTSTVETAFLHFAYSGPAKQTTNAISRVRPRMPFAFGYAIYAHGEGCNTGGDPGGVIFNGGGGGGGGGTVTINGGGIMSNTCLNGNGSVDVQVNDGGINCVDSDCPNLNGGAEVSPAPQQQPNQLPEWALLFPEPDCSGLSPASSNGDGTISPGIYDGINVTGSDNLTMEPGLYCFTGDLHATGGSITGNSVTIYMQNGGISVGGGVDVFLTAPTSVSVPEDGVQGMLIFMAEDNADVIALDGNSNSSYTGVIFSANPDSEINISGTSDAVFNTQLIAGQVTIGGNANITVNFDDGVVYHMPAQLTLQK